MNIVLFCAVGAKTSKASILSKTMHMHLFCSHSNGKNIPLPCHASIVSQADWTFHDDQFFDERCEPKQKITNNFHEAF